MLTYIAYMDPMGFCPGFSTFFYALGLATKIPGHHPLRPLIKSGAQKTPHLSPPPQHIVSEASWPGSGAKDGHISEQTGSKHMFLSIYCIHIQ